MQLEIYQYLNENKAVVASYSFNQSYKKGLKRPWVFVQELVDGFKVRSDLKDLVMLSVFEQTEQFLKINFDTFIGFWDEKYRDELEGVDNQGISKNEIRINEI